MTAIGHGMLRYIIDTNNVQLGDGSQIPLKQFITEMEEKHDWFGYSIINCDDPRNACYKESQPNTKDGM